MSDFVALKPESIHREIRNTLFGDVPLKDVVRAHPKMTLAEPWAAFQRARDLRDAGDVEGAKREIRPVLTMPDLETRVFLQAWHTMRELGENPPADRAKEVLGIVVEVGMPKGLDIVAAYRDHRARYFNYSGAGVLWERRDESLDALIDELLTAGSVVANAIPPWTQPNRGRASAVACDGTSRRSGATRRAPSAPGAAPASAGPAPPAHLPDRTRK